MSYSVDSNCVGIVTVAIDCAYAWIFRVNPDPNIALLAPSCSVSHLNDPVVSGCWVSSIAYCKTIVSTSANDAVG